MGGGRRVSADGGTQVETEDASWGDGRQKYSGGGGVGEERSRSVALGCVRIRGKSVKEPVRFGAQDKR